MIDFDIVQSVGWIGYGIVVAFVTLIVALGAHCGWQPDLPHQLRSAAQEEIARRGVLADRVTVDQATAMQRMVGEPPAVPKPALELRLIGAIAAFSGASDGPRFAEELRALRDAEAEAMLLRLRRAARRSESLVWASRLWQLERQWSTALIGMRGMVWLIRRGLPNWGEAAVRIFGIVAVAGPVLGLLWWGVGHGNGQDATHDWTNAVGIAVALISVIGIVFVVGGASRRLVMQLFGPPRDWTARGALLALVVAALPSIGLPLATSGMPGVWIASATAWAETHITGRGETVIAALVLCGVGVFALQRSLRWSTRRYLLWSERLMALSVSLLLMLLVVSSLLMLVGEEALSWRWLLWCFTAMALLAGVGAMVARCVEAWRRSRLLREAGWSVAGGGLHWWMPVAWLGAVGIGSGIERVLGEAWLTNLPWWLQGWLGWVYLLLVVSSSFGLPVMILIAIRSIRAIRRDYEKFQVSHRLQSGHGAECAA